jgi:hypothetical protein
MKKYVNLFGLHSATPYYVCQIDNPAQVETWLSSYDALPPTAPEKHWCAMCSLRSIMLAEHRDAPPLTAMFSEACARGVYKQHAEFGWDGAYHAELADFAQTYAQMPEAIALQHMETRFIEERLGNGYYCMLSTHPDIRLRSDQEPQVKRGHFVLIYGYARDSMRETSFLICNSTGFASNNSQVGMWVPAARLRQVSSGDGVLVKSHLYA